MIFVATPRLTFPLNPEVFFTMDILFLLGRYGMEYVFLALS